MTDGIDELSAPISAVGVGKTETSMLDFFFGRIHALFIWPLRALYIGSYPKYAITIINQRKNDIKQTTSI